jgi:hypothetical protein
MLSRVRVAKNVLNTIRKMNSEAYYLAGSIVYKPPPPRLSLRRVVVIHRHGDRSQISRSLGPHVAESEALHLHWACRMPAADTMRSMAEALEHAADAREEATSLEDLLYSGEDKHARPYAQLTEVGARQLIHLGSVLRERYAMSCEEGSCAFISPRFEDATDHLYLRSTNTCRTLQSLRCLIAGLYALHLQTSSDEKELRQRPALQVSTRPKSVETLHAQLSEDFIARRAVLLNPTLYHKAFPNYAEFEARMRKVLGYEEAVNWLVVKEVLTCHKVHEYPFVDGIRLEDEIEATRLCAWIWGRMYEDDVLNRMSIGKFVHELLHDVRTSSAKMLIYSGHDSTLVPILCLLGLYEDEWPPYASFLTLEFLEGEDGATTVRAIYNDKDMKMLQQEEVFCPMEIFETRLRQFADGV